jgi:deferrochelatase/peroxidase EfeB
MYNVRPGVDDNPADFMMLVKINVPFDDRDKLIGVLKGLQAVQNEKMAPARTFATITLPDGSKRPAYVVADRHLNLLVGFGLRFFLGPIGSSSRAGDPGVPNFPPGGTFAQRQPTRFGMADRAVPLYLRTMSAAGDQGWIQAQLTAANNGTAPAPEDVDTAYNNWLSDAESDLILQIECENDFLMIDFWDAIRERVVDPEGLIINVIERGSSRKDGKAHIGFFDGTSNLNDLMRTDPMLYRSKIFTPVPGPAYPGQSVETRDDPRYDGATYMVYRKYRENLDAWFSDDFQVTDFYGNVYKGDEARLHAIGRSPNTGKAISRASHQELNDELDHTEINLSFNEAHALKARGGATAPFMGPFPPVAVGKSNAFNTQDIRIRRRGLAFAQTNPQTGEVDYGLHFICFQNNIQQTGFEFINNIWLINPDFRRSTDGLMNPVGKIITPLAGCYYFVPPQQHSYPGDVFFE